MSINVCVGSKRFFLPPLQSPTIDNLAKYLQKQGWRSTRFKWRASFGERNLQFDLLAAECLEFKNLLAKLVARYCPQVLPETFCINDQNWSLVLSQIADKYHDDLVWILKPALLNNGQHIKIFQRLNQLEQHYLSSKRMGGEHVLQRYLVSPHLLRGHKYSIRLFVVITNYAGAYLYPHGYFNVALQSYQPHDFSELGPHLTNEHLSEPTANVVQIPTTQFDFYEQFYPQLKATVTAVVKGLKIHYPTAFICQRQRAFAIFGFDFMVDADKRVWLLEANHGPWFPIHDEHPLQKHLYRAFWQALINSFVVPIAMRQPVEYIRYHSFESLL